MKTKHQTAIDESGTCILVGGMHRFYIEKMEIREWQLLFVIGYSTTACRVEKTYTINLLVDHALYISSLSIKIKI